MHSACFLLLFSRPCPIKSKEIYTDVGYGHSPYYDRKAICFWFICGDGVDQAKFRVRRALSYHFVVADADMKTINCTPKVDDVYQKPDAVADADMNK